MSSSAAAPPAAIAAAAPVAVVVQTDADASAPGVFGPAATPHMFRTDYVTQSSDSYWLTNPKAPITGFNRIIGDEGTERSLRTRLCILQAERRLAGTDGRPGNTFTIPALQDIVLSSQIYSVEIARKQVLDSLCTQPLLIGSAGPVAAADQAAACAVLAKWDGKDNLASVGSHVWREFFRRAVGNLGGLPVGLPATPLTGIWQNAFSASDPVNTPNTLNTNNLQVQQAFADGIAAVIQRLMTKLENPPSPLTPWKGVRLGMALFPNDATTAEDLVALSHLRLTDAKHRDVLEDERWAREMRAQSLNAGSSTQSELKANLSE